MNREEAIKKYLKENEKDVRLSGIKDLPADMPDALVFTNCDCSQIVDILKAKKDAAAPVKRVIAQGCVEHPRLRGWLKDNDYLIYGEELWKEEKTFCETTAAVLESMADEKENEEAQKGLRAEIYYYGTEETYNELPLLLRINNNQVLPEFLYWKIEEAMQIAKDIEFSSSSLPEEMLEKNHKAKLRVQQLGIAGNSMYPID